MKSTGSEDKMILLIEDNPDDEALTLRALKQNNILDEVIVAHDGAEALDYLFGTGPHAGRDLTLMPQVTQGNNRRKRKPSRAGHRSMVPLKDGGGQE
jgi:hypothetical protein